MTVKTCPVKTGPAVPLATAMAITYMLTLGDQVYMAAQLTFADLSYDSKNVDTLVTTLHQLEPNICWGDTRESMA